MPQGVSLDAYIVAGGTLMALWGFYKVIMEIITAITKRHDKEKKWDEATEKITKEREAIVERYDKRLTELENKIDENHSETEAKIQELKSSIVILTQSVSAILDGLKQQGCNGKVTEAKENLDKYLMDRAYD